MKEQIVELLGRGVTATQVALAVGCDESYISQLLSDEALKAEISQRRAANFAHFVEHDKRVDDAEETALKRLETLIPFITKPGEAVRVFGVLNAAKRRAADSSAVNATPATIVQLEIPEGANVNFKITHDRQVIEVEGRSLATMPAKNLAQRLEQRNAARLLEAKVPDLLLNASGQVISAEEHRTGSKRTFTLAEQL